MEEDADPLRFSVNHWVRHLFATIHKLNCFRVGQTHFDFFHVPIITTIGEIPTDGKIVEIVSALVSRSQLPNGLDLILVHPP